MFRNTLIRVTRSHFKKNTGYAVHTPNAYAIVLPTVAVVVFSRET